MDCTVITDSGIEWTSVKEIKEILKKDSKKSDTIISFTTSNLLEICKFTMKTQSARRVLLEIGNFSLTNLKSVCKESTQILDKFSFKKWLDDKTTFRVVCERSGNHEFTHTEVEEEIGAILIEKIKKELAL